MRKLVMAVVASLSFASAVVGPVPTARGESVAAAVHELGEGKVQDPAEAMAADLEAMREARGWTADQLAAYEKHEAALDAISERLSLNHADAFVGSALAPNPIDRPTVYVKGSVPEDIARLAVDLGVDITADQPYSLKELDTRLATVQRSLADAGIADVVGWADIRDQGAITVVVHLEPGTTIDSVLRAANGQIADGINVLVSPNPVVEPQGAFGGMKLQDGGVFECTSGWTVRKLSNGVRGVSGAGHCGGVDQINHPGHGVHAAAFQGEHVGEWGDVEWSR
ncbi:hypothetical protein BH20CHL7_BH20CHL7_10640 [soil metagenome]